MAALQKFKEQGWWLSDEGLRDLSEDGHITDFRELEQRALNTDLRNISNGGPLAPDNFKPARLEIASAAGIVLQVLQVRNISAPKSNEESKAAPRMLKLDLTDGQHECSGLEMEPLSALSLSMAPGTKIQLRGTVRVAHGFLMLGPANVSFRGGLVPVLHERWEHSRALAKYAKGIRPTAGPNGPPPWITFGQRSVQQQQLAKESQAFRSLGAGGGLGDKDRSGGETKENAEFTAMRAEALAAAHRVKTKKVFGGGGRNMVDHNVKKICDKGFTEEEAKLALKLARNNLEKAMGGLKRDRAGVSADPSDSGRGSGARGRFDRRGGPREMDDGDGAKPSAKVSLFDFLTEKIPQVTEAIPTAYTNTASSAMSAPRSTYATKPSYNSHSQSNNHSSYASNNNNHSHHQTNNSNHSSSSNHRDDSSNSNNPFRRSTNSGPTQRPSTAHHSENGSAKRSQPAAPKSTVTAAPVNRSQTNGHHNDRQPVAKTSSTAASSNNNTNSGSNNNSSTASVSSSNPFSLENRAKFQNNMSSSFAQRNATPAAPPKTSAPKSAQAAPKAAAPKTAPAPQQQQPSTVDTRNRSQARNKQVDTARPPSDAKTAPVAGKSAAAAAAARQQPPQPSAATEATAAVGSQRSDPPRTGRKAPTSVSTSNGTADAGIAYNAAAKYQQNAPKLSKGGMLATGTAPPSGTQKPKPAAAAQAPAAHVPAVVGATASRTENPFSRPNERRAPNKNTAAVAVGGSQSSRATPSPVASNNSGDSGHPAAANKQQQQQQKQLAQLAKQTAALKLADPVVQPASKPARQPPAASGSKSGHNKQAGGLDGVLPNGFNPNKIMGFANKETNEVALNVMRALSLEVQQQEQQQQQRPKSAHKAAKAPQPQTVTTAHVQQQPQALQQHPQQPLPPPPLPAQLQQQPQQSFAQPTYNIVPQPPAPQLHMYGFQTFDELPRLKDVCFAKYWEDGQYYNAEITGVSESTCVVEFLEYGNFEEVLLADCVPITDHNIQLVNQFNIGVAQYPQQAHYPHHPAPPPTVAAAHATPPPPTLPPPMSGQPAPMGLGTQHQPQQQYYGAQTAHQQPLLQTPVPYQQPKHFNPTTTALYSQQQQQLQQQHQLQQQQQHQLQQQQQHQLQQQQHQLQQQDHHQQQQQRLRAKCTCRQMCVPPDHQQQQRMRGAKCTCRQMYVPPAQRSTK